MYGMLQLKEQIERERRAKNKGYQSRADNDSSSAAA